MAALSMDSVSERRHPRSKSRASTPENPFSLFVIVFFLLLSKWTRLRWERDGSEKMSATDLAPIVAERDLWDRGSRLIEHISTVALSKDSASERRHPPSRSPKCVYKASHRPRSSRHRQQGRAQPQRGPQNHRRRCRGTRASNRHRRAGHRPSG